MNNTTAATQLKSVISSEELLHHWQGHRNLTRRVIEAFPEKEFFEFSIGGMRTAAGLIQELISIAGPGMRQIATGENAEQDHTPDLKNSKAHVLQLWDEGTEQINHYWTMLPVERFHEEIIAFGMYPGSVWSTILYFHDNEIHHRAQIYVYLRALGIEPPFFYER
jgi:uncharacterized damage-inducible protein DinB